jgi:hypothetical protein
MSEPVAKPRYLGEPRNVFDLEEIERRMRESIEPPKPEQPDPLAELARLVGQGNTDAFSRVFADRDGPTSPPPARQQQAYVSPYGQSSAPPDEQTYAPQEYQPQDYPQQDYQPQDPQEYQQQAHEGQANPAYAYGHEPQGGETYAHHDEYAQHDAYAQPASEWQGYYQQEAYVEEAPRRTGRAKLLIGAAIVIAVGGSAAAFMTRGPAGPGREAPTILANAGPTKVQPAEQPSDGPKQSISILERGGAATTGQGKIVQNEEQPVDVTATARVSGSRPARSPDAGAPVTLAPPLPPPVANSLFAEPKRVKAVAVRPDGTIIDPAAPVRAPATPKAETPVAAPVTPPPTPAARPTDIASLVASSTPSTTPSSAPKPAARAPEPDGRRRIILGPTRRHDVGRRGQGRGRAADASLCGRTRRLSAVGRESRGRQQGGVPGARERLVERRCEYALRPPEGRQRLLLRRPQLSSGCQ